MTRLLLILSAGMLLAACEGDEQAPEPIRPVLSMKVEPQVQTQLAASLAISRHARAPWASA